MFSSPSPGVCLVDSPVLEMEAGHRRFCSADKLGLVGLAVLIVYCHRHGGRVRLRMEKACGRLILPHMWLHRIPATVLTSRWRAEKSRDD